jgi:hypothetical protein
MNLKVTVDENDDVFVNGKRINGDIGNCRFVAKYKGKILKVDNFLKDDPQQPGVCRQTRKECRLLKRISKEDLKFLPKVYAMGKTNRGQWWILEEFIEDLEEGNRFDTPDWIKKFQRKYRIKDVDRGSNHGLRTRRKRNKEVIVDFGY